MINFVLLLLRKDDMDPTARFVLGIVLIIIIAVIAAVTKANRSSTSKSQSGKPYTYTPPPRDPNLWYGSMGCYACGYLWQSRKNTPPASCPKCRSKSITIITGNNPFVRNKPHSQSYTPPQQPQITPSLPTPHEILQIPSSASKDEISAGYKRMAQMYHPDKVASLAPEFREIAERKMKEINAAYAALKAKEQTQAITQSP